MYVSDPPGHHDHSVLRQLVLPDGTTLRALLPGRPTRDNLFSDVARDGKSLLKVCGGVWEVPAQGVQSRGLQEPGCFHPGSKHLPTCPCTHPHFFFPLPRQVWNMNPVVGVVGVFNIQGAAWDRTKRRFHIHTTAPPPLSATVRVSDVEPFKVFLQAAGCNCSPAPAGEHVPGSSSSSTAAAASGNGVERGGRAAVPDWVLYVSATGKLCRVRWSEGVEVTLQGEFLRSAG